MSRTGLSVWISANTCWYVANFRSRLIEELISRGYSVTVLSPADSYVSRIRALGADHRHIPMVNDSINPFREIVLLARFIWHLALGRPDVLLTFTPKPNIYGSIAGALFGIPVVPTINGLGRAFAVQSFVTLAVKTLYWWALRSPAKIYFQNEDDRSLFVSEGLVDPARTERIPGSGVDIERFSPVARAEREGGCVFLLVARLLWDKGIGEFVEAARLVKREFPNTEFHVVGFLGVQNPSAIPRETVEEWVAEGVIRYLGASDDVREHYARADCVVLPTTYREGVPRVLLEAASMALPVITTDVLGCRDVVEDGVTGLICRPRDAQDLAAKIRQFLVMSPEDRAAMGRAGRQRVVARFDERMVIDRYLGEIERICCERLELV